MGEAVRAIVRTLTAANDSIKQLEQALASSFDQHPDAEILDSLPVLGLILGARVLGEFGDDPTRFTHAASRRAYAGTAPITRASGRRHAVPARHVRNKRLADACYHWAFSALTRSTGARAYYDQRRAAGDRHNAALRRLASNQTAPGWSRSFVRWGAPPGPAGRGPAERSLRDGMPVHRSSPPSSSRS
jgi:transposase